MLTTVNNTHRFEMLTFLKVLTTVDNVTVADVDHFLFPIPFHFHFLFWSYFLVRAAAKGPRAHM